MKKANIAPNYFNKTSVSQDDKNAKSEQSDDKDNKNVTVLPSHIRLAIGRVGGKGKLNAIKTCVIISTHNTSAANTANTAVINVDPTASAEFASIQQLFDEMIVDRCQVWWRVTNGGAPTVLFPDAILAYDPMDPSVYGTFDGALIASQSTGPHAVNVLAIGSPLPVTKTGWWNWAFKCPTGASKVASATAADQEIVTGQWTSTNTAVTPKYGFIKPYISALGGTGTSILDVHVKLHMRFRSRT
jgi:hypothetical protein